jgi:hypothetical protein
MRNKVKPRTSNPQPVIRYLFAIIPFLLKTSGWLSSEHGFHP